MSAAARRRRRLLAGGVLLVLLVVAGLVVRSALALHKHGATLAHFTLHSRMLHRSLKETTVVPAGGGSGRPLLVFLHGKGEDGEDSNVSNELFAGLAALGSRAPDVVFANGGDDSYWHDRADGPWGSSLVDELIPAAVKRLHADSRRVAIGGVSMGGYGAYDVARLHPGRFCAVGGHSAAIWLQGGDSAPGAFDDAEDYARHDVLAAARHDPKGYGPIPLWLDVGDQDPFRQADTAFATALRAGGADLTFHVWPGQHEGDYWRSHMKTYLRFYADALASCHGRG